MTGRWEVPHAGGLLRIPVRTDGFQAMLRCATAMLDVRDAEGRERRVDTSTLCSRYSPRSTTRRPRPAGRRSSPSATPTCGPVGSPPGPGRRCPPPWPPNG
ncbi:hypothetical protein V2I01_25685 [Micromonospora sp. BRA006-A]|nr:hypothetical protein [Micromonospora sp. BRA006-A]